MKAFLRRIAMLLASGYILMFFSEFYFLNEGPGTDFAEHWRTDRLGLLGWLFGFSLYYASWGGILLACVGLFNVRSFWSLFIAGALFGWGVEGIVIPVIYEAMPGTLGWPTLGWHALVDVFLGWYLVRLVLHKNNYWYTAALSVALGLFWGVWCTWYWVEEVPVGETKYPPLPLDVFAPYVLTLGVLLILSYIVIDKAGGREYKPTIFEIVVLTAWHVFCFTFGAFAMAPVALYVLPALFCGGFLVLWWNRRTEPRPNVLSTLAKRVGWGHYALLLLMPVCAIPVYTVLFKYEMNVPILAIVGVPLMFIGDILLFVSVIMIAIKRPPYPDAEESTPVEASLGTAE